MSQSDKLDKYSVPIAILIAGVLIAGAVIFTGYKDSSKGNNQGIIPTGEEQPISDAYKNIKAVSNEDHISGDKNAKIKIVTFSDMECPYCINFEGTMKQVLSEYEGKVSWVYRHNPLDFHQNAMPAALASECVAEKGGEAKFWEFMTKVTSSLDGKTEVNLSVSDIAAEIGVDKTFVEECVNDKKYASLISDHMEDAFASGLEGTPYSVIIVDGTPVSSINGAYPFSEVKRMIDDNL